MSELKYAKYIITEKKPEPKLHESIRRWRERTSDSQTFLLHIDDDVVKGAPWVNCVWFLKAPGEPTRKAHTHDFDEILALFGTNPEDPYDLGGEVEFWLGDEKYTLTKSCIIFVPKGLKHCPLIIKRVDRPIFHFSSGPTRIYDYGTR